MSSKGVFLPHFSYKKFSCFMYKKNRSHHYRRGRFRAPRALNPQLFVKRAQTREPEAPFVPLHSYESFDFAPQLKQNITHKGYKIPTPIQDAVIPYALEGRDVLGIAHTGTGKTAAFALPLIQKIYKNSRTRVLILVPTRELALQIRNEMSSFSAGMPIYSALCIGGSSIAQQMHHLRRNPHIVIGTPGRLKDLYQRRSLELSQFSTVVLDEVDHMLDMGFLPDITSIVGKLPPKRHTLFFSATLSTTIESLAHSFLVNPYVAKLKTTDTRANIDQNIVRAAPHEKMQKLVQILREDHSTKVLIFSRTKHGAENLAQSLKHEGFRADAIHGNKTQSRRKHALGQFRDNRISILVATDVAARGLDIDNVSHVINYDAPENYDDYIHRIGRTGRGEKNGIALTFVS